MTSRVKTPVGFMVFNRPTHTEKVFERIRQAKPPILLVVSDGPREGTGDLEKNEAIKTMIANGIDWECDLRTNYSKQNLGCKKRISSGLDWVFNEVDEAIILEDDCLPDLSFFRFCDELLEKYRNDHRVSSISGSNPFVDNVEVEESYVFSKYNRIWGWASWRRAWKYYDVNLTIWPTVKRNKAHYCFLQDKKERAHFERLWDNCYQGNIDTWDYQWSFAKWMACSYTAVSSKNLIQNIGFGEESTHTKSKRPMACNAPIEPLTFPLKHPNEIYVNFEKDLFSQQFRFHEETFSKIKAKAKNVINKFIA